jgi:hypothetical protein
VIAEADAVSESYSWRTAWTRHLATPLRAFLRTETGSAAVLLAAAVAALVEQPSWRASAERGDESEPVR